MLKDVYIYLYPLVASEHLKNKNYANEQDKQASKI